jgi:hypothetical protein
VAGQFLHRGDVGPPLEQIADEGVVVRPVRPPQRRRAAV